MSVTTTSKFSSSAFGSVASEVPRALLPFLGKEGSKEEIGERRKILVGDDEESMVQFLSILLSRKGTKCTWPPRDATLSKRLRKRTSTSCDGHQDAGRDRRLGVLSGIKKIDASIPVVIRTAFASQKSPSRRSTGARTSTSRRARRTTRSAWSSERDRHAPVQSENGLPQAPAQTDRRHEGRSSAQRADPEVLKLVEKVADSDSRSSSSATAAPARS